ncbi:MAG: DUF2868 domain-containing protein [Akkermansiaceae bacterium]|nr:DUF2868 domain-containing protein [Akkermansiaceae bacterium]
MGSIAFLSGIGLARGLLQTNESDLFTRGYNVWIVLVVGLGVQGLLLVGAALGYFLVRRSRGTLSWFGRLATWLALRMSGAGRSDLATRLLESSRGYGSVLSWRVARLTQGVAIFFNLGLLAGLYGCLLFLSVRFYWESTFEGKGWGLVNLMEAMALPWSWAGVAEPPGRDQIEYSVLGKIWIEKPEVEMMWSFLLMSVAFYGLLPRLLLWSLCGYRESRALATLDFQAPRHRELWRGLTKVERTLASEGPADGAVLLDVGGTEVSGERVREFLLRELRVNPQARYTAAVLDEEREEEALEAIREAELGVVFLVEGWALSPKQMRVLHERVRAVGGVDVPVNFLVLGELRDGEPSSPARDEWEQWKAFVDSLRDPAAEAVAYRRPAPVGEEA